MKCQPFLGALLILLAGFLPAELAAQNKPQSGNTVPGRTENALNASPQAMVHKS